LNGAPITAPYNFPKGTNQVTCVAVNDVGMDTCAFTVIVSDTQAPAASASQKIVNGDLFATLMANDNCDGSNLNITVKDSAEGPCGGTFSAGPYVPGTQVKLTRTPKGPGVGKGGNGAAAMIRTVGNPVLVVTDSSGNTSCTVVPVKN
jgi:hypothetical protein